MVAESSKVFREAVRNRLSETLIIRQDLDAEEIERIIELQITGYYIYKQMEDASISMDHKKLRELAAKATETEFSLQTAWNFKQDITQHRFWTMPGCDCPVIINIEMYPSEEYKYSKTCPIHKSKCK